MENLAACAGITHDARSARARSWTRRMVRVASRSGVEGPLSIPYLSRGDPLGRTWTDLGVKRPSEADLTHSFAHTPRHIGDVDSRDCRPVHRASLLEGIANAHRPLATHISARARHRARRWARSPRRGFRGQVVVRGATRHRSRALRGDAPEGETSRDGDGVLRSGAAAGQTHGSHPRARLVVAERSRSLRLYVVRERRGDVSHRVGRPERRRDGRQLRGRREHRDRPGCKTAVPAPSSAASSRVRAAGSSPCERETTSARWTSQRTTAFV